MWFVWSSGSKQAFQPGQLPAPRGRGRGKPRHPARRLRVSWAEYARVDHAGRRIRAVHHDLSITIVQGPSTGGDPRSVPRRLASPLPSSTFGVSGAVALEVLPTGVRDHTKVRARDPPDLDADFSVTSRSMRSGLVQPDFLSWGCPKIAPPSFRVGESVARAARLRAFLRRKTASLPRVPSPWFLTTSTVCSFSTVQVCFTLLPILGFAVFPLVAKRGSPQRCSCPSKLSLRR